MSTVAGFRGAVSLAIALSVPVTTAEGAPVAGRDAIVFVTAGVIVLTLLVQGPLLPAVIRWAKLPNDDAAIEEYELAERAISGAALAALDDLATEHGISDRVRDRARREGYERLELANARAIARQRAIEERDLAELDASLGDDPSSTGPVPPDGSEAERRRAGADSTADSPDEAAAFTGPLQMIAVSDDIDVTQRSPCCATKRRNDCGWRCWTASARCCCASAAKEPSTTSSRGRFSRASTSKRSARGGLRRRASRGIGGMSRVVISPDGTEHVCCAVERRLSPGLEHTALFGMVAEKTDDRRDLMGIGAEVAHRARDRHVPVDHRERQRRGRPGDR